MLRFEHSIYAAFLKRIGLSNPLLVVAVFVFFGLSIGCEPTISDPYQPITPTRPQTPGVPFFKANAGEDIVLYVPNVTVQLDANRSEDTGRIVTSYTWEKLINGLVVGPAMKGLRVNTTVEEEGIHLFKLTATSRYGTTSFDTVKVTLIDNFALGIPPTFNASCDTIYRYDKENIYIIEANAVVDSAGFRYDLSSGYTFTQLTGPSTAKITPNPNLRRGAFVENISTGIYSFKVQVDRKGLKVYDTLALALLPDTAKGKEYIMESLWELDPDSTLTGIFAIAKVQHIQGLLLSKNGRDIKVWIAEGGNSVWTELSNDWFYDPGWYILECFNALHIIKLSRIDRSIIGKKLKVKISIIN